MQEALENIDELESYKGKWRNLWFLKDGRSFEGNYLYPSEQAASDAGEVFLQEALLPAASSINIEDCAKLGEYPINSRLLSHGIPIPVGDA